MIVNTVEFCADTWEARFAPDGRVEILKNGSHFDIGFDDGEIIHHTKRTPEEVLKALEAEGE